MHLEFLYPAQFFLALGGVPSGVEAAKPKNAILLSEVQSLTLRGDAQTTNLRVPAAPQLKCVSHKKICDLYKVDTMRCVNQGSGYSEEDIQWSCTASLPRELKLGSTDVVCEGYASSSDPYVLKGSCGVEYRMVLTDEGEARHPELTGSGFSSGDSRWVWVFWLVFIAVAIFIVYSACVGDERVRRVPRRNNFWGGGDGGGGGPGWGGGGGWNEPPPPYPGTKPYSGGAGWRPGFWSGTAAGAAAGYMAGNRGRNTSGQAGYNGGGSTWGGSGGAGPSSSSSASGARHSSTGFGSTSRR